jgi:hypothetical protein
MAVPAGFEDLAKTQRLWTEVNLYGESLGLFETDINLETVSFIAPETVVAAIKRQFNDNPSLIATVSAALAVPLARNGNLACSSNSSATGCDYIDTQHAAIIYDENNARISLFLDKKFLPKPTAENQWYQPTQGTENALIHQQNINFVADRDYQSATVQGNGALAVTQDGYLNLDWTWLGQRSRHEQQQEMTVNNAWFRQDLLRQYYVQFGAMDTRDLFSNAGEISRSASFHWGKFAACARAQREHGSIRFSSRRERRSPFCFLMMPASTHAGAMSCWPVFISMPGRKTWIPARSRTGVIP